MRAAAAPALAFVALAACAPMSVSGAEQMCRDRLAPQSGGEARIGVVSDGSSVRLTRRVDVGLTLETGGGRDPEAAWRSCVYRASGQLPTRPFRPL
jgi:hypothetical protein